MSAPLAVRDDSEDERLSFILEAQRHCDHFLTPIADPAGKSVLVVGCGAGTEMLWCLRRGAREVVGIDKAPQSAAALAAALRHLDLRPQGRWSMHRMAAEEAERLGRSFDLVLSNNVFEHLEALASAFGACARLVAPGSGRVAVFTDPLFFSSAGSHLPVRPWEHLWGREPEVRRRLLAEGLGPHHPLSRMTLERYMGQEITLNRMRLVDFLAAVVSSGLVLLNLRLVRDRNLDQLGLYLERVRAAAGDLSPADLAIEGIAAELMRLEPGQAVPLDDLATAEEIRWRRQTPAPALRAGAARLLHRALAAVGLPQPGGGRTAPA
jgi:SAM-dependent methyltransferase